MWPGVPGSVREYPEATDDELLWQAGAMIGPSMGASKNATWKLQRSTSCTSALVRGHVEEQICPGNRQNKLFPISFAKLLNEFLS